MERRVSPREGRHACARRFTGCHAFFSEPRILPSAEGIARLSVTIASTRGRLALAPWPRNDGRAAADQSRSLLRSDGRSQADVAVAIVVVDVVGDRGDGDRFILDVTGSDRPAALIATFSGIVMNGWLPCAEFTGVTVPAKQCQKTSTWGTGGTGSTRPGEEFARTARPSVSTVRSLPFPAN